MDYDQFTTGLAHLRAFASAANVIGPIHISFRFSQRRDSAYFAAKLKMDCKELSYNLRLMQDHDWTKFEMCGFHIRIENDK